MARALDDHDYTPHGARERRLAVPRPKRAEKSELRRQIERAFVSDHAPRRAGRR